MGQNVLKSGIQISLGPDTKIWPDFVHGRGLIRYPKHICDIFSSPVVSQSRQQAMAKSVPS